MTNWTVSLLYLFPPILLLQRTIIKICQDNSNAIVITSQWPRHPWLSTLWTVATDYFHLPLLPHLLTLNQGKTFHLNLHALHLTEWRVTPQSQRF